MLLTMAASKRRGMQPRLFLSMKTGVNMISTKDVSGRVTLMVLNVPAKDVFDIMLRSNGLAYTKEGEIYNIMSGDEYKALFGKKFSDIREVKVFKIKYAIPEQVFTMLDALKSEIGRVLVEPDSGKTKSRLCHGKVLFGLMCKFYTCFRQAM